MKESFIVAVAVVLAASMMTMYEQGLMIRFSSISNSEDILVFSKEVGGGRQ